MIPESPRTHRNQTAANHGLASLGTRIEMFDHLPVGLLGRRRLRLRLWRARSGGGAPTLLARHMQLHGRLVTATSSYYACNSYSSSTASRLTQRCRAAEELSVFALLRGNIENGQYSDERRK